MHNKGLECPGLHLWPRVFGPHLPSPVFVGVVSLVNVLLNIQYAGGSCVA